MWSWFRRKRTSPPTPPAPPPSATRPAAAAPATSATPAKDGKDGSFAAVRGNVAFENGQRSWTEDFDCVQSLQRLLAKHGHQFAVHGDVVFDQASGFSFRPLLVGFQPVHGQGV